MDACPASSGSFGSTSNLCQIFAEFYNSIIKSILWWSEANLDEKRLFGNADLLLLEVLKSRRNLREECVFDVKTKAVERWTAEQTSSLSIFKNNSVLVLSFVFWFQLWTDSFMCRSCSDFVLTSVFPSIPSHSWRTPPSPSDSSQLCPIVAFLCQNICWFGVKAKTWV